MGGGSSSKSTLDVATTSSVEILTKNVMKCTMMAESSQEVNISGSGNLIDGMRIVQFNEFDVQCFQESSNIGELQQQVENSLKAAAEAHGVALIGVLGNSESDVTTRLRNDIKQKITTENISEVMGVTNSEQIFMLSGSNNIIRNLTMEQSTKMLVSNMQKLVNGIKSVQDVVNSAQVQALAKQDDPISGLVNAIFGGVNTTTAIFAFVFVVAMVLFGPMVFKFFTLGLLDGDSEESREDQQMAEEEMMMEERAQQRAQQAQQAQAAAAQARFAPQPVAQPQYSPLPVAQHAPPPVAQQQYVPQPVAQPPPIPQLIAQQQLQAQPVAPVHMRQLVQ